MRALSVRILCNRATLITWGNPHFYKLKKSTVTQIHERQIRDAEPLRWPCHRAFGGAECRRAVTRTKRNWTTPSWPRSQEATRSFRQNYSSELPTDLQETWAIVQGSVWYTSHLGMETSRENDMLLVILYCFMCVASLGVCIPIVDVINGFHHTGILLSSSNGQSFDY